MNGIKVAHTGFVVVTPEEAQCGIQLDSVCLAGIGRGGNAFPVQGKVYRSRVRALVPMIDFRASHPTPRIRGKVSIAVMQGDNMLTAMETEAVFDAPRISMTPATLELADLPVCGQFDKLQFIVLLNEQFAGEVSVSFRKGSPPCADAQGCLVQDDGYYDRDFRGEAFEIMQDAVVR